jgi:hypothetical protein
MSKPRYKAISANNVWVVAEAEPGEDPRDTWPNRAGAEEECRVYNERAAGLDMSKDAFLERRFADGDL